MGGSTGASGDSGPKGDGPERPAIGAGTVLGKYKIIHRLGSGGMGAVYEAVHTAIGKPVALKTMSPALAMDPRAEQRFLREAAAASRLQHPHVVNVTDFGSQDGVSYLVMELLRGEDLGDVVARESGGMNVSATVDIMLGVAAGVFAAHESGVVHRDLKPQNIFLAQTALDEAEPKVLDFGISKRTDNAAGSLTDTGAVMGTTHYLSPEQVLGRTVDQRSDQYALGVILYECLTGRRPHDGETLFLIMRNIGEGLFVPPRVRRPEIPVDVEQIILRAMSKRPEDRFESVHELGRALLPHASERRRAIWSTYYQRRRSPGSTLSPPMANEAPRASRYGQTRHASDNTRSGVAPISVSGTGALRERATRLWPWATLVLGMLGAGGVAGILLLPKVTSVPADDVAKHTGASPTPSAAPTVPPVPPESSPPQMEGSQPTAKASDTTRAAHSPPQHEPQANIEQPERPPASDRPAGTQKRRRPKRATNPGVEYIDGSPLLK